MKQPPKMVSTKDAMYISDILPMNFTMIKKTFLYEDLIKDENIQKLNNDVRKELKAQYKTLMEVLNSGK